MILKNGKRIDGCTDTLPVGTVQPFLGLTPPLGYLICQGQLISKVEYPELYNICKSTFGTETDTHFYLPDLRGKTVAGYCNGDDTFNILGLSLGEKTHLLTELESGIREHTHAMPLAKTAGVGSYGDVALRAIQSETDNEFRTGRVTGLNTSKDRDYGAPYLTGTRDANAVYAHNNIQPTMVLNWIVKAVMLIPEYFMVENTLTSTSTSNALSAAQGKILNDSKLSLSGGILTGRVNVEVSGVSGATEVPIWSNAHLTIGAIVTNGAITRCPSLGFVEYQNSDGVLYMKDRALFWASSNNNMGHIPAANTGYEIVHTGNKEVLLGGGNWVNGTERPTLDSINGKTIYKKYVTGNFNGLTNVVLATGVDQYIDAAITVYRDGSGQWHRANAHVMAIGSVSEPMSHIDCIFQKDSSIMTYTNNSVFTNAQFRGFIYYTKL